MSETINELYLKYVDAVSALEDDRYFRYLFEIIQAGNHVLQQNRQVLHKVVDETWLTVIEDSLDALNTIIEKPRRFVATTEEVVPVALARKITAQSVRHLSMNTHLIASSENGDIQPTRVLNTVQEDSYDLYENRFIYHLIQKLVVFIDKRTDVLFWSTGDEVRNTMVLESKIDDAYEEIEYKLEMKVKNHQSFAENDADHMDVFMRIDRVRRMTMALYKSAFCELMAGCAKVHSPIQRTNLLMKDPNYRKCYQLWQFLESYEDVGYTIEEQNAALEFDEEYLIQVYINLISSYAVFKSLTNEVEERNLDELSKAFHQVLKPKFVKQIREEIVDDYNIPDVEIRQVIVEEVTQAQLEAQAKLAEETALREQAEAERDAAEAEAEQAAQLSREYLERLTAAQEQTALAEAMRTAAQQARDAMEAAKVIAEEQLAAANAGKAAAEARCRAAEEERDRANALAGEAEQAKLASEAARCQAERTAAEAVSARAEAEKAAKEALLARDEARRAQLDAESRAQGDREAKALADEARDAATREKQQALRSAGQASLAAAEAREKAAASGEARTQLEEQLKAALAALEDARQARASAEQAEAAAEAQAQLHRAARQQAEAAADAAEQARKAAEAASEEAAKREAELRNHLGRTEKKLAKARKRLESAGSRPFLRIGK